MKDEQHVPDRNTVDHVHDLQAVLSVVVDQVDPPPSDGTRLMPGSLDALTPEQQPPWLSAAIDQRMALMKDILGPVAYAAAKQMGILMTPLTEPSEFATPEVFARWDHSCDNCGKHCVGSELLHYGNVMLENHDQFEGRVVITFGACSECATWVH